MGRRTHTQTEQSPQPTEAGHRRRKKEEKISPPLIAPSPAHEYPLYGPHPRRWLCRPLRNTRNQRHLFSHSRQPPGLCAGVCFISNGHVWELCLPNTPPSDMLSSHQLVFPMALVSAHRRQDTGLQDNHGASASVSKRREEGGSSCRTPGRRSTGLDGHTHARPLGLAHGCAEKSPLGPLNPGLPSPRPGLDAVLSSETPHGMRPSAAAPPSDAPRDAWLLGCCFFSSCVLVPLAEPSWDEPKSEQSG
jgi:hypothetical protein